jgi:hypothetical protein
LATIISSATSLSSGLPRLRSDDLDRAMIRIGQIAVDGEVVVVVALHRRRFAAPAFAGVGKVPEMEQLVLERLVGSGPPMVSALNQGSISWWRRLAAICTISSRDSWLRISSDSLTVR